MKVILLFCIAIRNKPNNKRNAKGHPSKKHHIHFYYNGTLEYLFYYHTTNENINQKNIFVPCIQHLIQHVSLADNNFTAQIKYCHFERKTTLYERCL